MQHAIPTTEAAFAHAVRYRDAMLQSWMVRTGRYDPKKGGSYKPEDVPSYIDPPTNAERSRAEVYEFTAKPLAHGKPYFAYLTHVAGTKGTITTFTGDVLARVVWITNHNRVVFGRDAGMGGSFRAVGIDGRLYYGRHNGTGMYCRMRLAKWAFEYDTQMRGAEGWETVTSSHTFTEARQDLKDYTTNAPEFTYRIKRQRVRQ